MKKRLLIISIFGSILLCSCLLIILISFDSNRELELNEIKAYFKQTTYLDYQSKLDTIEEIQIGGTVSMPVCDEKKYGNAVYTKSENINKITEYLNTIPLVEVSEKELHNKSADSYIQYFDYRGILIKNFTVYGQVFIKDVTENKLYRIKKSNTKIVEGLEKIDLN